MRLEAKAAGHEMMAPVAQDAHQFGGQRLVQEAQHGSAVTAVGVCDRALVEMLPCHPPQLGLIGKGGCLNVFLGR